MKNRINAYKQNAMSTKTINVNTSIEGESIEVKMERILSNKEPLKDGAPLIFTERKEGVRASTNIRTDRFMVAVEATDKIAASYQARRDERAKLAEEKKENNDGVKPVQGTESQGDTK